MSHGGRLILMNFIFYAVLLAAQNFAKGSIRDIEQVPAEASPMY